MPATGRPAGERRRCGSPRATCARGGRAGFITLLTGISVVGVTVGVTALLTVLAVMNGFENEVRDRIAGTDAHVVLLSDDPGGIADTTAGRWRSSRAQPDVAGVAPFAYAKAMVIREGLTERHHRQGRRPAAERGVTTVARNIRPALDVIPDAHGGRLPGHRARHRAGGRACAPRVGDRSCSRRCTKRRQSPLGLVPRLRPFRVVGIFESGLYEYDSSLAYVSIDAVGMFMHIFNEQDAPLDLGQPGRPDPAPRGSPGYRPTARP